MRDEAYKEASEGRAHGRQLERDRNEMAFRESEGDKNRAANAANAAELVSDEEGNLVSVYGDKATNVTRDGKPMKGISAKSSRTDLQLKLEIANKLYPDDPKKAFAIANGEKRVSPVDIEKLAQDGAKTDLGIDEKRLEKLRADYTKLFGEDGEPVSSIKKLDEKSVKEQFPDARQGPDGNWYVPKPSGGWRRVTVGASK